MNRGNLIIVEQPEGGSADFLIQRGGEGKALDLSSAELRWLILDSGPALLSKHKTLGRA